MSKKQLKKLAKKMKAESGEAAPPAASERKKQKKENAAEGEKKEQKEKKSKDGKTGKTEVTASGLKIKDVTLGKGKPAKKGDLVSMRYIGKLENGKVFDSNTKGKPVRIRIRFQ